MDKPRTLSVKDYLIRKLAVKMLISEKTLDTVITHQFKSALEAMNTNDSIEISGFGKFLFNRKKLHKKLEKNYSKEKLFRERSEDESYSEKRRASYKFKLENTLLNIEELKNKI